MKNFVLNSLVYVRHIYTHVYGCYVCYVCYVYNVCMYVCTRITHITP
jgi:hypothetical protein